MSLIRILPTEVANRIAAGEVVERPASIVKELIENSIDAKANRIVIKTQNGGKTLIQITDNGCGMDSEDALLCLEAHATSKIKNTLDIMGITTMGFRGEAIPSIASVSHFLLQTRIQDATNGTEILVEHGTIKQCQSCGCAPGTHIRISHLFANLPGRRKFLKSNQTEDAHIQECVLMQALAHPDITFDLTINERSCFFVPGNTDLKTRIGLLLGKEIVPFLIPIHFQENDITITGFVSRPDQTRPGRKEQRIFINHRPAAAESIYHAIRDAYGTLINRGSYPVVILYLEMDPQRVDVNVHPAKKEVRFRDERNISFTITNAIRNALQQIKTTPFLNLPLTEEDLIPELMPKTSQSHTIQPNFQQISKENNNLNINLPKKETFIKSKNLPQFSSLLDIKPVKVNTNENNHKQLEKKELNDGIIITTPPPPSLPQIQTNPHQSEIELKSSTLPIKSISNNQTSDSLLAIELLGQLSTGDIVASGKGGLVLIDPIAAQQRIIFEQLVSYKKQQNNLMLQPLLIPLTIHISPEENAILNQNLPQFKDIGFNISPFGGRSFIIETIPSNLNQQDPKSLILEIIEDLRLLGSGKTKSDELRLAKMAAKRAASPKKNLTDLEAENLIKQLLRTEMPYTTPDGRATMINLPFNEIDRRFLRSRS